MIFIESMWSPCPYYNTMVIDREHCQHCNKAACKAVRQKYQCLCGCIMRDLMPLQDAMRFPLIGSAVLLGLFLLFKFLPQDLINTVLTGYFVLIGIVAVTVTISPFVGLAFTAPARQKSYKMPELRIPYIFKVLPFISSRMIHPQLPTCFAIACTTRPSLRRHRRACFRMSSSVTCGTC